MGKTYAVAQALHPAASARIAVGTTRLAAELGATYGFGVVRGRNAENCQQFELTEALGKRGHNVAELACGTAAEPRCPYRANCPYWRQFEQRGPLVAAAEQLFNPAFIRPASVVVVDDADLARSLIECHTFSVGMLTHAVRQLKGRRRDPLRQLLRIIGIALVEPPAHPLRGAAVWDRLAWVAAVHGRSLVQIIAALPQHPTLPSPTPDTDGRLSVEAVDKAPPAALLHVVRALQEELPAFLAGEDFNSRLRLNAEGIEVARLRDHPADALGRVYIDQADLLVLDATPIDPLVDHLTRRHERLPDVVAEVALPSNVRVVQYAERPNGHRALSDQAQLGRVLAEIERERRASPTTDPTKEAVIGYRGSRDALLQAGFAASQVLTFGSARGTNALADVDRLHVVGRPMPPAQEMAYLAQVIHHDERPVSEQLRLGARPFGGQPHAVDVVDFIDPRVSALLRARRDDEVLQAVHRARVGCLVPQQRLDGTDRATRAVTLVIHTSHPIPGLRVE